MPVILVATTALVLCATVASAQDDRDAEAKALFQAGREAFDAGRYDAALDAFTAYLHLVPNADNRDEVEQRIRALE